MAAQLALDKGMYRKKKPLPKPKAKPAGASETALKHRDRLAQERALGLRRGRRAP
jgi:hypothetical protein